MTAARARKPLGEMTPAERHVDQLRNQRFQRDLCRMFKEAGVRLPDRLIYELRVLASDTYGGDA